MVGPKIHIFSDWLNVGEPRIRVEANEVAFGSPTEGKLGRRVEI